MNAGTEALMARIGAEIEFASLYWDSPENALLWARARRFSMRLVRRGRDDRAADRAAWRFVRRGERLMTAKFKARVAALLEAA